MKIKIISLLIVLLLVTSCSKSTFLSNQQTVNRINEIKLSEKIDIPSSFFPDPIEVVSIGDSLTEGVGDSTDNGGYLPYLKHNLESEPTITSVHISNHGVRGNRTDQLLKRLDNEALIADIGTADSVVITIGGNDIMKVFKKNITNLELEQFNKAQVGYEKRLVKILNKVRGYNEDAQIYLVGVYNPFSKWFTSLPELETIMDRWNKSGREIVAGYNNAHFVEIGDIFENTDEDLLYTDDYFHPNDRGYELIANRIYSDMDIQSLGGATAVLGTKGVE